MFLAAFDTFLTIAIRASLLPKSLSLTRVVSVRLSDSRSATEEIVPKVAGTLIYFLRLSAQSAGDTLNNCLNILNRIDFIESSILCVRGVVTLKFLIDII